MRHPKAYQKMLNDYMELAKNKLGKQDRNFGSITTNTAAGIASEVARRYSVSPRAFALYINKLVEKGVLPKDLRAEFEPVNETMSFQKFRRFNSRS